MHSNPAKVIKKVIYVFIIAFNDVNLLDVSGPAQVFTQANHVQSNTSIQYKILIISKSGGLVQSNSGICIDTIKFDQIPTTTNTVLIAGGFGVHKAMKDQSLVSKIKEICVESNRVGSVCTGAFLLAMTGILDGKKAVTHWRSVKQFQDNFPAINVEHDPIYIHDQGIWTSAGISAGIDLALAMVEQDLGHQSSLETAREMVVYLKRTGGQAQFSILLHNQSKDTLGVFDKLHDWVIDNLHTDLSVDQLADQMNMSQRTFFRLYKKIFGITPAKNINKIRIEFAKQKLESSSQGIKLIAKSCGFNNENRFRRAFINQVGIAPITYRMQFGSDQSYFDNSSTMDV